MRTAIRPAFSAAFISASALLLTPSGASAGDTQAAWDGIIAITASTSGCSGVGGTSVGDLELSVYRPHILSTDTTTFLSVHYLRASLDFENSSETANPQMNGSGNYTGFAVDGHCKAYSYQATFSKIVVSPHPVAETSTYVTVTGTINNVFDVPGCNVTFVGHYSPGF